MTYIDQVSKVRIWGHIILTVIIVSESNFSIPPANKPICVPLIRCNNIYACNSMKCIDRLKHPNPYLNLDSMSDKKVGPNFTDIKIGYIPYSDILTCSDIFWHSRRIWALLFGTLMHYHFLYIWTKFNISLTLPAGLQIVVVLLYPFCTLGFPTFATEMN